MNEPVLGIYDDRPPTTTIVVGLGFGDEGKGMTVAHETGRALIHGLEPVNVRFGGGPQAGHNVRVRMSDGSVLYHKFAQFGSGTLYGAGTIMTKGMLFAPVTMGPEADHLLAITGEDPCGNTVIDARCPVIMPTHVAVNRAIELSRGGKRHGTTGFGVGIARTCEDADVGIGDMKIDVRTLLDVGTLTCKLWFWSRWLADRYGFDPLPYDDIASEAAMMHDRMTALVDRGLTVVDDADSVVIDLVDSDDAHVVFESSQGMLLDMRYGWFPHVTYGDMTPKAALEIIGDRPRNVIGVTRTYQTRHGAGPLPSEGTCDLEEPDALNGGRWSDGFRTGLLDVPTLCRVVPEAMVDGLAVSCVDRYPGAYVDDWGDYRMLDVGHIPQGAVIHPVPRAPSIACEDDTMGFLDVIETRCGRPIVLVGEGPATEGWTDL